MALSTLRFELILAAILLALGLLALPMGVYWVGQIVIGGYESDAGMGGLIGALWDDLGRGGLAAWFLVLSPYIVVQLGRGALRLLKRP